MHGGGVHVRSHAWWGCTWQGVCMAGGGHAWWGCTWQGPCMVGGALHGRVCMPCMHTLPCKALPCQQTDSCENITFANFVCGRSQDSNSLGKQCNKKYFTSAGLPGGGLHTPVPEQATPPPWNSHPLAPVKRMTDRHV